MEFVSLPVKFPDARVYGDDPCTSLLNLAILLRVSHFSLAAVI